MFSSKTINKLNVIQLSKKNFGANEKALKMRIKSVGSIAKITKAMKMVSSSKMKAELVRLNRGKLFGHEGFEKIFVSDLYMQRQNQQTQEGNKILYVPFTSDKGLCGGINTGIVREVKSSIAHSQNKEGAGIYVIGDKGSKALGRPFPNNLKKGVHEILTPINFTTVSSIAHDISMMADNYDKIVLIYNRYISAISSVITKTELMPRKKFLDLYFYNKLYNQNNPVRETSNPALYDLYLASNLYQAQLNNLAAEQSARMNAMGNASKNAAEIQEKLILSYNKARQARITMELVEIISGASAV
jgi:F-type H+-transporting ATPase subunit gamma